ncbi:MAG: uncharacterized protein Hyperionvirus34_18 [Hyperionvirus sp.]|uniref:J domain-containing protein n=1 Tax=Hyperionvirus sp. TaxID=2487770 RepID=A0A3G5ADJ9_9VIRU|nr:MAG: uncharacterized protein Hyperionvirus34_18 [Hyperionvirus sp.]
MFRTWPMMSRAFGRNFSTGRINPLMYNVLGIKRDFSKDELKKAYIELCKRHHPDVNGGKHVKFLEVQKAFGYLSDSKERDEYDRLDEREYKFFEEKWRREFNPAKERAKDLGIALREMNMNSTVVSFVERVVDKVHRAKELITYKPELGGKGRFSNVYFVLDGSESMNCYDVNDQRLKGVGFKDEGRGWVEGAERPVRRYAADRKFVDGALFISKCISAMNNLVGDIKKVGSMTRASLRVFGDEDKVLCDNRSLGELSSVLKLSNEKFLFKGGGTKLYDAILGSFVHGALVNTLGKTLFVVLTDGVDNASRNTLEELVEYIKKNGNIHIVLIGLGLYNVEDLRKIANAAKFGRVMQVGDRFEFGDVESAYREIGKQLLLEASSGTICLGK